MRFVADECCDGSVVKALQAAGHDVLVVGEVARRLPDDQVMELAVRERRILLTEDKDFGQWIHAGEKKAHGVIFLRYPHGTRKQMAENVLHLVQQHGKDLESAFVVVEPGRVRINKGTSS